MSSRFPLALLAAALAAAVPDARACSVCGCGDPFLAASDPAAISGQLRLQLDTEYLTMSAANEADPAATDKLTQWSYRLNAVYRPLEPLSLMVTVPLVSKVMKMSDPTGTHTASNQTGIGDLEVAARYSLWTEVAVGHRRAQEVAVSLGTALPTGSYKARDSAGDLVDMHGQVGTGSWGPFAGLHYRLEQGDWLAFASLSGRLRTETSLPEGGKYGYGDAVLWSVHGQYRPVSRLALDLGLDGRTVRVDKGLDPGSAPGTPTEVVPNTGGTVMSIAPGAYFNAAGGLWFFLRGQVPVYKDLFGTQNVGATVTTGFQVQAF
jgi:hypothetical protein